MIFMQNWVGKRCGEDSFFPATVPGNIQYDYSIYRGFGDLQYSDNHKKLQEFEDDHWEYKTELAYDKKDGERVFFVGGGIDYKYDILVNGKVVYSYEGMFKPCEIDITDELCGNDTLVVHIYPHPKRVGAPAYTRDEADESCKPPVCYGWDWNPRLLISGLWQEAYIETRDSFYIGSCEALATLNEDMTEGKVDFTFDCEREDTVTITLYDRDGNIVYSGKDKTIKVASPNLWWCNGQGEPYLYRWEIRNEREVRTGHLGFRRIRFVRNVGEKGPSEFPKTRYTPAITIELNGRRIFAKGSNWVNPDIFWGQIDEARYDELLTLVRDCNMNILRLWGGASVCKDVFYDLCDKYGILVWQEFMLACNNYKGIPSYMKTLESEATYIIKNLRSHPSLAFWCGGNELFNSWSGMDDQSLPLRLLNKLCFEYDPTSPFIATSPLMGMAHGGYRFYEVKQGGEVFHQFQRSRNTAYTEFGVPGMSSLENLKKVIPEEERFPIGPTKSWIAHHGLEAWGPYNWVCMDVLEMYFGKQSSLEEIVENSTWLQCEGYKAAFEEMRRQWPHCSMALNWCYNEPWITAANNSLIEYPTRPKPAYYAVKNALRPTLFSAKIAKFSWEEGETFEAELWLLNDAPKPVGDKVKVFIKIGDAEQELLEWSATATASLNTQGPTVRVILPRVDTDRMTLILRAESGSESSYTLQYKPKTTPTNTVKILNI